VRVDVDVAGFEQRVRALPVGKGDYRALAATDSGVLYIKGQGQGPGALTLFDLEAKKEQTILGGVANYALSADHKKSLVGSDEAAGGLQFLQDLIWKHKVMPDASITDALGDAFEQGQAAMEANGSWLVATDEAAGLDFGIAPLPKGSAGQATSINPTGAVVYKGTKNPDAAWEFVKYLASPAAQTKIM